MKRLRFLLLVLVVVATPVFAQPSDVESLASRYFVVVWAYEGDAPRDSHTFATFYKGDDLAKGRIPPLLVGFQRRGLSLCSPLNKVVIIHWPRR
jgi:hypothetical protein